MVTPKKTKSTPDKPKNAETKNTFKTNKNTKSRNLDPIPESPASPPPPPPKKSKSKTDAKTDKVSSDTTEKIQENQPSTSATADQDEDQGSSAAAVPETPKKRVRSDSTSSTASNIASATKKPRAGTNFEPEVCYSHFYVCCDCDVCCGCKGAKNQNFAQGCVIGGGRVLCANPIDNNDNRSDNDDSQSVIVLSSGENTNCVTSSQASTCYSSIPAEQSVYANDHADDLCSQIGGFNIDAILADEACRAEEAYYHAQNTKNTKVNTNHTTDSHINSNVINHTTTSHNNSHQPIASTSHSSTTRGISHHVESETKTEAKYKIESAEYIEPEPAKIERAQKLEPCCREWMCVCLSDNEQSKAPDSPYDLTEDELVPVDNSTQTITTALADQSITPLTMTYKLSKASFYPADTAKNYPNAQHASTQLTVVTPASALAVLNTIPVDSSTTTTTQIQSTTAIDAGTTTTSGSDAVTTGNSDTIATNAIPATISDSNIAVSADADTNTSIIRNHKRGVGVKFFCLYDRPAKLKRSRKITKSVGNFVASPGCLKSAWTCTNIY